MRKPKNIIQLKKALFADSDFNTYAVLDGAAIPELWDHLYSDHAPEYYCLFENTVPADVLKRAPYLVALTKEHEFTDWLLTHWHTGWGIFALAETTHNLNTIRQHFRKMIMVYGARNTPMLYRYYDPLVLTGMLPQYTAQQLKTSFGQVIKHYIAENELTNEHLQFGLQNNQLTQQRLTLN